MQSYKKFFLHKKLIIFFCASKKDLEQLEALGFPVT